MKREFNPCGYTKSIWKKLLIIFIFSLSIRVLFILTLNNSVDVWGDWWDELGWKIASGKGFWVENPYFPGGQKFYSWRTPGFPFFLAIIYKIFGHNYLAAKIGLAIISSFTCILIYFLLKEFFNSKISFIGSFLYSIYPSSIFWTGYLAPETLEVFLMVLFSIFLIKGERKRNNTFIFLSGLFLGIGVLTRSLFFVFIPLILLHLLIEFKSKGLLKFVFLFLGCFLMITPWVVRNYKIHKTLVLTSTEGGIVCYIANNEKSLSQPSGYWNPPPSFFEKFNGMSEVEIDHKLYELALNFILSHPKEYLKLVWDRFIRYWRFFPHTFSGPGESYKKYHVILGFITFTPIIILSFIGFFITLKNWKKYLWIYFGILGWSLPTILLFKTVIRYREPIIPYLMVLLLSIFKNVEK